MADRIEREINEILERLEDLPGDGSAERRPISIAEAREQRDRKPPPAKPAKARNWDLASIFSPTHALIAGAGTVIGGLILSNLWAPLIWAAFAGVAVFIAGFIGALIRRPATKAEPRDAVYWRDRYIQYDDPGNSVSGRIKKLFRR
jgi:hypothetical protein